MAEPIVFVGTYTSRGAAGIYVCRSNPRTGELRPCARPAPVLDPSFLALHPSGRRLYAASELERFRGLISGAVCELAVDPDTGGLEPLREEPTHGVHPCHVAVDRAGRALYAANYSSGSVAVFPLGAEGALGPALQLLRHEGASVDPRRQKGPHAHGVFFDPSQEHLLVPDLGLDRIVIYDRDPCDGRLSASRPAAVLAPGSGPRHFAFTPDGTRGFVVNELASTVCAFRWQPGSLTLEGTVPTLPEGWSGSSACADIHVSPDGRFVYASNRGHDSIAAFGVEGGSLRPVGITPTGGKTPRNFAIDPSGRFLYAANMGSGTIVTFGIDARTGALEPAGPVLEIPAPVCILIAG